MSTSASAVQAGSVTTSESVDDSLVEEILEDPDDRAAYLVYGDWLQSQNDPRGKLIAVQAARADDPHAVELAALETRLLDDHRDSFLGRAAELEPSPAIEWSCGFWRALRIASTATSSTVSAIVEALVAEPSARLLRELVVDGAIGRRVIESAATKRRTLERLELQSCHDVTSSALEPLSGMQRLRSIELREHPLDDDGTRHLVGLPLAEVRFNKVSPAFTVHGMRRLATLPLHTLALDGETIDDPSVASLADHPTLANVELAGAGIDIPGMVALGTLPKLRRLYVPSSTVDDSLVPHLAPLADRAAGSGLRALFLGHCERLTDAACETIARFSELAFLDVSATQITGSGVAKLATLRALEHLDLGFLDLDDAAVRSLLALPSLTALSLIYSRRITDAAIDVLVELDALEQLDLGATSITVEAIDRLSGMPNLHRLGLMDCDPDVIAHARSFEHWYVTTRDSLDLGAGSE